MKSAMHSSSQIERFGVSMVRFSSTHERHGGNELRRLMALSVAVLLVAAACGGESTEDGGDDGGDQPTTSQPADGVGGSGEDDGPGGEGPSTATVTIGDETYEASLEEAGDLCLPDLFGIMSVNLPFAVGDGFIEIIALHEGTDPVEMEMDNRVYVRFADGNWIADPEDVAFNGDPEGAALSHVDSVEIDGNTLKGTASFVGIFYGTQEEVTMTGTFEATCGE